MDNLKSIKYFFVSGALIILNLIIASLWESLNLGENKIPLAISIIIAFIISLIGFIIGIKEIKNNKSGKAWTGLVGNLIVIFFFVFVILYSLIGY